MDDAKVATLRELLRRFPPAQDVLDLQIQLVQSGEAELVSTVEPGFFERGAKSPEHLALLRAIGTCSWIVVPLKVQDVVFGSLVLAYSDSNRHYNAESVRLAREVARRAAVAIDNARLYELSQKERSRVEATTRAKDECVATAVRAGAAIRDARRGVRTALPRAIRDLTPPSTSAGAGRTCDVRAMPKPATLGPVQGEREACGAKRALEPGRVSLSPDCENPGRGKCVAGHLHGAQTIDRIVRLDARVRPLEKIEHDGVELADVVASCNVRDDGSDITDLHRDAWIQPRPRRRSA